MRGPVFAEISRHERDLLRASLEAARLPADDIDAPDRRFFNLTDDAGLIGFIGIEGAGRDRLLRSLVVLPTRRGQGFGKLLVGRAEAVVAGEVDRLHLLTKGAAPFFRGLDYKDAERAGVPSAIAATEQFTLLCPASAVYLVKDISV